MQLPESVVFSDEGLIWIIWFRGSPAYNEGLGACVIGEVVLWRYSRVIVIGPSTHNCIQARDVFFMNKSTGMFGISLIILTLIVAVILGFMAGPTIPFIHRKMSAKDFLEWKNEYNVGIDSIDQQHRRLVSLINQLQTAVNYSTGEEFEREALDQLVDYTKTHFTYEEGLMEQNDYPDFESHRAQHKHMIQKVEAVLAEYEKDKDTAMNNALNYLSEWLINHINGTDKEYSSYLIGKGVK